MNTTSTPNTATTLRRLPTGDYEVIKEGILIGYVTRTQRATARVGVMDFRACSNSGRVLDITNTRREAVEVLERIRSNKTPAPSTANVKTAVLDALEQAVEGRVDGEGFLFYDTLYLTVLDLATEVRRIVPGAVDRRAVDVYGEILAVLHSLKALSAAVWVPNSRGVVGWRLTVPENVSVHALLEEA